MDFLGQVIAWVIIIVGSILILGLSAFAFFIWKARRQ